MIIFLQALLDPSQGFCNFILFIITSDKEREEMYRNCHQGMKYCINIANRFGIHYVPYYATIVTCCGDCVGRVLTCFSSR